MAKTSRARRRCFVILPFAGEFEDIFHYAIQPTAAEYGYLCERVDTEVFSGPLVLEIVKRIASADLVIADLSQPNPNTYYELGIVHALGVPVILLSRNFGDLAFDIRGLRVLVYESINALSALLGPAIVQVESNESEAVRSPVLEALPKLDRVPRSELDSAKTELGLTKRKLATREKELDAIKATGTEGKQIAALKAEIMDYLKNLTTDVVGAHARDLAVARAEGDSLKQENERLRRFELEIRRMKEMVLVNPRWPVRGLEVESDLCFLLMPFSEPWSEDAWKLIESVVISCGMRCRRADEQEGPLVMQDIWDGICRARVIIADLTAKNSNVTYEVGLADVLGKDIILLSQTPNDIPFDFIGLRLVTYDNSMGGVRKLSDELRKRLERFRPMVNSPAATDA
ncbi:MAG TPA: hypothetical protein VLL54_14945 [Pyrinomonadaceae bacterium]|nr:hypothetical protein [Pyrinomonadaceae bacterium]